MNKTGLRPISRPVEQTLGFFPKDFKKVPEQYIKFHPKRIIQKELSTNKSCEEYFHKNYPNQFLYEDLRDFIIILNIFQGSVSNYVLKEFL